MSTPGMRERNGVARLMPSIAGSARASRTTREIAAIRPMGSSIATGPAKRAATKRLPPSSSPSRRTEMGIATGIVGTGQSSSS